MAHIYVYSPSGAVLDRAGLKRGIKRLKALGHEVEVDPAAMSQSQRFAGDDAERLAAITRAANSRADVAMMTRGGYGLTRLLPQLPYQVLAKAVEQGTQFVGLSDFTALSLSLLAQTGTPTWQGPLVIDDFGQETEPDDIMQACLDDLMVGHGEGAGWMMPKAEALAKPLRINNATLWGGNLSVLCSMVGTPYLPAVKGGVLFVEDVAEHPYRVERMLTQLQHAGVLKQQKALLMGRFTQFNAVKGYDRGFGMESVVARLREQLNIPVLTGLPLGHVPTKVLLPVGQKVSLVAEEREALLFWG
jgi:muramoyltetrapeptide carboxypeptidase